MRVPIRLKRYYQTLRDVNFAVFGAIATCTYTGMYVLFVPIIWIFSPNKKRISHTAWNKWPYTSETLEDLRKQY